ncbi:Putative teichuronic acid biosynthesis glycosyl transferase TuaC [Minicystis rosea]|nr:Putative teichuronic acid biosynthesis glycosyl transferase TuaC [Minicystis rosea]
MRIAVLTTSFPRSAEDPAGHFVRSSALALAAEGHEVHVVTPGGSPLEKPVIDGPLRIHHAGGGSLFTWPGAIARVREAPWRILASGVFAAGTLARLSAIGRVDRVVAHWIVPCAFPLAVSATRAPLEVHAHGADVRLLLQAPRDVRERILAAVLAREGTITFAAAALRDALAGSLRPELAAQLARRAHVEAPPIDVPDVTEHAASLRAALQLADGERLAVAVCRLIPSKRVDLAIEAAHAAGPSVRLVVVGDGPEREALVRQAEKLGARVTFAGALPRREAVAWIAAADVLLHPSAVEAAPTVIREARALGVPVIACDAGDVSAWAQDDAGIRVVAGEVDAIARALTDPSF